MKRLTVLQIEAALEHISIVSSMIFTSKHTAAFCV